MSEVDVEMDQAVALLARALHGELYDLTQTGITNLPKAALKAPAASPGSLLPSATVLPARANVGPVSSPVVRPTPTPTLKQAEAVVAVAPKTSGPLLREQGKASKASNDAAGKLLVLKENTVGDCTRCKLHRGRNRLVFGEGNPNADLVFVGEGPGADEDRRGSPFVGRAGQLLTDIIENGMKYKRDDVYLCNVVKCRPPNNRDPEPDEVESCEPFLKSQLAIIQPKVIVGLGKVACNTLLKNRVPIGRLRGQWDTYEGIPFMPTYHPAFLLRDTSAKRPAWADLKRVMAKLAAG